MICVIGGYPKGHDEAFSSETVSGRRLRKIADRNDLELKFLDVWETEEEEDEGKIDEETVEKLKRETQGHPTIALGKYVYERLKNKLEVIYLPHPAARHKKYLKRLEEGLIELSQD